MEKILKTWSLIQECKFQAIIWTYLHMLSKWGFCMPDLKNHGHGTSWSWLLLWTRQYACTTFLAFSSFPGDTPPGNIVSFNLCCHQKSLFFTGNCECKYFCVFCNMFNYFELLLAFFQIELRNTHYYYFFF